MSNKPVHKKDVNQAAKMVVDIATIDRPKHKVASKKKKLVKNKEG